jgi:hypothetical protein
MWQTIPGVVRNNGTDTFRLEINVNGTVSQVTMKLAEIFFSQSGQTNITLNDYGTNGDIIAHDGIFTSEPLRFDTNFDADLASYYEYDTNSPAGAMSYIVGIPTVVETNGMQSQFLIGPEVGILDKDIPLVQIVQLSSNLVVTPHLLNVLGTNLIAQKILRAYSIDTGELPKKIYAVFPDAFDFLVYFSTYHIEYVPGMAYPDNGVAGTHQSVQINYAGTGQGKFNDSANYGSFGKLLGINALDTYDRGMLSGICGHEILHQWGSYMSAFPFSDGEHYTRNSNVGSLLGGFLWIDNGDGTLTLDCNEGASGATHLDPLDQYLMGLIDTNLVTSLRVYAPTTSVYCRGPISNIESPTTIQDIVATYGQRTPGPAAAQRKFSIGFIAESYEHLLNQVELTYYDIFAAQFAKPLPPEHPAPYVGPNWVPLTRFFEGTTWTSDVLSVIQPLIRSIQVSNGQCQIAANGTPGWSYKLQGSTNMLNWSDITSHTADPNGSIIITDPNAGSTSMKFYRLVYP